MQIVFLNFYANKWKQIQDEIKDNDAHVPAKTLPSNEAVLSAILDANDHVVRIGSHRTPIHYSS